MQLQLDAIHDRGGIHIVRCKGRIIFGPEADAFTQKCEGAFFKGADLVVNLTDVRSIDNHGVGALVGLLASAKGVRRDMRLVLPKESSKVAQLLKLMKVYDQFQVFGCEEDAVGSFRPQAFAVA
jgi:anti-anti-sigma factor